MAQPTGDSDVPVELCILPLVLKFEQVGEKDYYNVYEAVEVSI